MTKATQPVAETILIPSEQHGHHFLCHAMLGHDASQSGSIMASKASINLTGSIQPYRPPGSMGRFGRSSGLTGCDGISAIFECSGRMLRRLLWLWLRRLWWHLWRRWPVGISVVYYSNRCSLLLTAFCCILVHFNAFNKISLHSILMHFRSAACLRMHLHLNVFM